MISSNTKDDFEMDENVRSILLAYPFTVLSVWIWVIFSTIVTAISTSASPSPFSCTSTCNSTYTSLSNSTCTCTSSCTSIPISTSSSSTLASRGIGQQSGYDPSKGERTVGDAVTLFNWWWKSLFWDLIECHWVY